MPFGVVLRKLTFYNVVVVPILITNIHQLSISRSLANVDATNVVSIIFKTAALALEHLVATVFFIQIEAFRTHLTGIARFDLKEIVARPVKLFHVSGKYSVSEVNTENLYERMTSHIDDYLLNYNFEKGTHTFFFPPYSSLFWCDAQNSGYFDAYLRAKQYFVLRATEYGANVYDSEAEKERQLPNRLLRHRNAKTKMLKSLSRGHTSMKA